MRWGLLAIALAACTDEGAHLTFSAPDGPIAAASYQLVLASPDHVPAIDAQRVTPNDLATESVTYYLQSTEVASGTLDHVDGFSVLVRPSADIDETSFIPFVALYGADGALVGMGTFREATDGPPQPILIQRTEVDVYPLSIEPVDQVDGSMPVATREAMPVDCIRDDQTTWPSGIVWRPRVGGELRLMFPDGDTDATARPLDLDCDGHEVSPDDATADCDDTRGDFHAGAAEACDGEDTNCDAVQTLTVPCNVPSGSNVCVDPSTQMGVALCDDRTGTVGECMSDPQCLCAIAAQGCVRCVLGHATNDPPPGDTVPCQPGTGQISTQNLCDGGSPCTVQVVGVRGGWDAQIAGGPANTVFGPIAVGVGSSFSLRAKRPEGPGTAIPGMLGQTVGQVDLNIIDASGANHYMGVDLEMDIGDSVCAANGPYQMHCSP
jgi:hypothetical protein